MKLWIVYNKKFEDSVVSKTMFEAAQRNGIDCEIYYFEYFSFAVENYEQKLFYKSKEITSFPDVVFARGYNTTLCSFLEKKGAKFINSRQGTFTTLDKLESHFVASQLGIAQPKTLYGKMTFEQLAEQLGLPFIAKNRFGSKGANVFLINSKEEFEQIFIQKEIDYIYQEYIEKSKGQDLRIYFVGDKIAGAVKRICTTNDFRSNVSLGATSKKVVDLPPEIETATNKFAKHLDLHFCSVDFLIAGDKYLFCEANSNAGFSAFFENGMDMQQAIMEYIKKTY